MPCHSIQLSETAVEDELETQKTHKHVVIIENKHGHLNVRAVCCCWVVDILVFSNSRILLP